ncbi:hypothetical protein L5515_003791 [Caenorhabditis briggsae]|uniref:Secreted protein n=1 Tax=Caenorhabditis briggsae TaxID=6238 RepID=A0AAE9ELT3_CAEBR|nr:hypothetical protein L5515_003791 [Caenorhabditis briggsae]
MNILGLLLLVLLAIAAPIAEAGRRCRSSTQCDYQSVCYNGYCYTIDEMFEKDSWERFFANRRLELAVFRNQGKQKPKLQLKSFMSDTF